MSKDRGVVILDIVDLELGPDDPDCQDQDLEEVTDPLWDRWGRSTGSKGDRDAHGGRWRN